MHRFVLSIAVLALALASSSLAATGGGRGGKDSSSLSLVMLTNASASASSALSSPSPSWGDTITFNISTTATQPSVAANCFQNGALVYTHYGFFYGDPSPSQNFVLKSSLWTGGAADCTATLYYMDAKRGKEVDLATLPFSVNA